MIDIKQIRTDPDRFIQSAKVKNIDVDIRKLLQIDSQLLDLRKQLQDARTEQNAAGKQIAT
ncbi:MAG: serine--tRNA ligase, partial [Phycisphaerae bacterium]|nr:serine--tRNA ligase [Phycisphaerae bacterium]